ncbi:hypothetical protein BGW41_006850 [Actinomortierella wolfii]|nr:hypothetical protein BGW41_006850 [Actinomortierella wolfii]
MSQLVAQTESIRRLYCPDERCKKFMHRDVMAGHNICNAILGHLEQQQRPHYLQPVTAEGTYPWAMPPQPGEREPGQPSMMKDQDEMKSSNSVPRSSAAGSGTLTRGHKQPDSSSTGQETQEPAGGSQRRRKRPASSGDDDVLQGPANKR